MCIRDSVNEVGGLKNSICFTSFADTMIRIASFIGAFDVLKLVEPPTNPDLIVVELTRAGGETELLGQRLSGTSCDDRDGWVMEDTITIRLCGSKRPAPGDQARVLADGGGGDPNLPVAERCKNRDEAPAP